MSGAEVPKGREVAVVPRGHRRGERASVGIDRLLMGVIGEGRKGVVQIIGPPGGGKSFVLRYLREALPGELGVKFFEMNQGAEARAAGAEGVSVLAALGPDPGERFLDVIWISPWTLDDCVEYLVCGHRERCASVLARLGRDRSMGLLKGSPQLLAAVLDAMAGDEMVESCRDALLRIVREVMPTGMALERLVLDGPIHAPLSGEQGRWWRHERVQHICMAEWLVSQICEGIVPLQLDNVDEIVRLIPDIAEALRGRAGVIEFLSEWIHGHTWAPTVSVLVSVLVAIDGNWRPGDGRKLNLCKAEISGAKWAGLDLSGAILMGANLSGADLEGATLTYAKGTGADLSGANLCGARMQNTTWERADFRGANLSKAAGSKADFSEANFESANLEEGDFCKSVFWRTNLSDVRGSSANFFGARLAEAIVEQADFSRTSFREARLERVDMSAAHWEGGNFATATLRHCNLEGLEILSAKFDEADLTGCLLTGSRMPGGSFRGANLTRTGLADIEWEDADLCDADFHDASFHMGSTRSGMVGSVIPCEGSKTGFYTDEFNEQLYKSPEEIRKANLCRANLIGAKIEGTDFYLVDLRGARYSKKQAAHFSKSGAILRSVI